MTSPIVLLESDPSTRSQFEQVLRGLGYQVATASTSEAGRALLAASGEVVLVANLLLDDGPTFDLVAEWRQAGRPLLAVSDAYRGATAGIILRDQLGLEHLLEVPAEDEELVAHITALQPPRDTAVDAPELEGDTDEIGLTYARPEALDPTAVPMSGTFDEVDVATVLARLAIDEADGALMMQGERLKKLVYFKAGVPIGVKSNLLQECLGQLLVQDGLLTAEACDASLEEMRRTQRRQGEVLVEMGHLTRDELDDAVRRQFWVKFRQLFTWTTGIYRFRDTTVPSAYRGEPFDTPANLIWQAVDQVRLRDKVRALMTPVLPNLVEWCGGGLDVATLQVDADIHPLFDHLDGSRIAADALAEAPDPDRAELLLYALTAFGAVTYVSAVPSAGGP